MRCGSWRLDAYSFPGERAVRIQHANCRNGLHRALREAGEGALNAGRRWCLEPSIEEQTVIKWGDKEGKSVLQGLWKLGLLDGSGARASGVRVARGRDCSVWGQQKWDLSYGGLCHAKKLGFYLKAKDPCEESWIWISFYSFWRFIFQKKSPW